MHSANTKKYISAFIALLLFITIPFLFLSAKSNSEDLLVEAELTPTSNAIEIYQSLNIKELSFDAFSKGFEGYLSLLDKGKILKENLLTIVDFSKPSDEERLFVIDLLDKHLIEKSLVAHGRNSGNLEANSFSNTPQSYQSSLGFYLTAETYIGKHGYSLRLDGLEKGINDNARERAIVIHGADYVSDDFIQQYGRLGRSFGCPALPQEKSKSIINSIKEKSCLFIYYPSDSYFQHTTILKKTVFAGK